MATTYRIQFNNVEEQLIEGTLTDASGSLGIIDIEGAEDAIRIVSQDNDESKYSPIKAKKCIIKFLNSQTVNFRTFASGEDNKWLVTVKINSLTVFIGHLEQGDIQEPFQYEENQIVTLTASDGLGALKTHRLEDIYSVWSATPCGFNENRIIDYIAACLGATGLELKINVINNLREIDNPATDTSTFGNIYAALYLSIKTWEDGEVGKYLNCYDILEKILDHDCFVTQAKGMWWIIRVTEFRQDFNMTKTVFDFDGTVLSAETLNYEKGIGLKDLSGTPFGTPDATAFFSQDKTMLSLERPVKSVSLQYKFDNPIELLANATLQRGDFIADLADELDLDGNTLTVKSFETECWDYQKLMATDPPVPTTQDSTAYIKVRYREGHEVERYIHFEPTAAHPAQYQLVDLTQIPIGASDRFSISFAVKWNADLGGAKPYAVNIARLKLYADDGSFWGAQGASGANSESPPFWMETDSDFKALVPVGLAGAPFLNLGVDESMDLTNWNNVTFNIPAAPRSGKLEFLLFWADEDTTSFSRDTTAIDLTHHPFIGGAYDIFSSQVDTSTRDGVYFSSIEDEVFISNAPRPTFKGALLKPSGGDFIPVGLFYEGQQYDDITGPSHLATYGELRVRAYHNQFRNGDEIYKATCQGLGEGATDPNGEDDHPDIIHRYFNKDLEPSTVVRAFQLVAQDIDLRNCEWTGTLIKTFDTDIGFVEDTYTFSYGAAGSTGGSGGAGGGGITSAAVNDRFGKSGEDDTAAENRNFDLGTYDFAIVDPTNGPTGFWVDRAAFNTNIGYADTDGSAVFVQATGHGGASVAVSMVAQDAFSGNSALIQADGLNGRLILSSSTPAIQFANYGAGTITSDASGNLTSVSDERLKNIIGEHKVGIDHLMKIHPIRYKWNDKSNLDKENTYIGFSAQDIQKALGNDAVGHDKNGYLSIQDRAIMATLVNAIKEQQKEIEELKAKINAVNKR